MNIVITGAARGIGLAIARRFAEDITPHTFLLSARKASSLEETANSLQKAYSTHKFLFKVADLSIQEEAIALGEWCINHGVPDILVNNAGTFLPGNIHSETVGTLEAMINTNLYSAYWLTRKLLASMMESRRGHIFNMCSIASLQAYPNGGAYSISKFALSGFSKNLREEMKSYNIKVTAVYPGAVFTDSWAGSGVSPERIMEASDVAQMIWSAAALSPQACIEDIILRPQAGDL